MTNRASTAPSPHRSRRVELQVGTDRGVERLRDVGVAQEPVERRAPPVLVAGVPGTDGDLVGEPPFHGGVHKQPAALAVVMLLAQVGALPGQEPLLIESVMLR